MLLQSLRRSRTLARLVLVWFVLAMGVAVAAPAIQPLAMAGICSASAAAEDGSVPQGNGMQQHASLQCILCLSAGGPPVATVASFAPSLAPEALVPAVAVVALLAPRNSPLLARAPPAL